jgi:ankyrin repeat protein
VLQITQPDIRSWTPLHYACYHGHGAIVEMLLRRGAAYV